MFIYWPGKAEDAQARGDWEEARRCWYYAAQDERDGDVRSRYNKNEDACAEHARLVREMQS